MAGVAITLKSDNVAGGSGGDTITTTEYTTSANAASAVTNGLLPVTTPVDGQGDTLKERHIPLTSIQQIVSL